MRTQSRALRELVFCWNVPSPVWGRRSRRSNAEKRGDPPYGFEAKGDAFYKLGQFDHARRAYLRAFEGVKITARTWKAKLALRKYGRVAPKRGSEVRRAVEHAPSEPKVHDRLVTTLVWLDQMAEAAPSRKESRHYQPGSPSVSSSCRHLGAAGRVAAVLGNPPPGINAIPAPSST